MKLLRKSPQSDIEQSASRFFGPEIWQLQDQGGVSRYFGELISNLAKIDTRTTAFLPTSNNQHASLIPNENISTIENQRTKYLVGKAENFVRTSTTKRIYHATYYSNLDLKKFQNANFHTVITVFDLISEKYPENKVFTRPRVNLKKKSIRSANHIICISQNTKNDLQEYYSVSEEKISVIHLGSNLQSTSPNAESTSRDVPYLLFVGKRKGYKNFKILLKVFSEIKTLKSDFQIIAFGSGVFEVSEIETMKSLGIEKNVVQLSGDDAILSTLYKGAYALVYPSLYEGFGLPPIEAMKLGCPVIASNTSSIPEICKDGVLYFNPREEDELALILEESLCDPAIMKEKVIQGRIVAGEYTWEKTAFETNQVYRQF